MSALDILNRPFASEPITGLMLPDGIFEIAFGHQLVNAQVTNTGPDGLGATDFYLESTDHPGIVVAPATYTLAAFPAGASRVLSWDADFTAASPGIHHVSFIQQTDGSPPRRIIKKIFVTRMTFDPSTMSFRIDTPEGRLVAQFADFIRPKETCCGPIIGPNDPDRTEKKGAALLDFFGQLFRGHDPRFVFCPPGYLPTGVSAIWLPDPPYSGQYGDLPFQDPWWKVLLLILAILLLIAASIVEATSGSGDVTVTAGSSPGAPSGCCDVGAEGGGSSYVAAGLVAAAAAVATLAAYSDNRDPFRRGQDNTPPGPGELTTSEKLEARIKYIDPVALGRPFSIGLLWNYSRVTTGRTYTFNAEDLNRNMHVLSRYEIQADDVYRRYAQKNPWIVRGRFFDSKGKLLAGSLLFVQCFLVGPRGEWRRVQMQDDGVPFDEKPNDGTFTGAFDFRREERPEGDWYFFVVAQDVNGARPDLTPEEAAQLIGGMVVTQQLTIGFAGGTCPLVPDGHVHVA